MGAWPLLGEGFLKSFERQETRWGASGKKRFGRGGGGRGTGVRFW